MASELLTPRRVQVRWRDWLADGTDTDRLDDDSRRSLFARYALGRRERMNGRAAEKLAPSLQLKPWKSFADNCCRESLLRSRHVHVGPEGRIAPGTCAGIVLGDAATEPVDAIWRRLDRDHADRPIVGTLSRWGPVGLMDAARGNGFQPQAGYASKCHLCWALRSFLAAQALHEDELAPTWFYARDETNARTADDGTP